MMVFTQWNVLCLYTRHLKWELTVFACISWYVKLYIPCAVLPCISPMYVLCTVMRLTEYNTMAYVLILVIQLKTNWLMQFKSSISKSYTITWRNEPMTTCYIQFLVYVFLMMLELSIYSSKSVVSSKELIRVYILRPIAQIRGYLTYPLNYFKSLSPSRLDPDRTTRQYVDIVILVFRLYQLLSYSLLMMFRVCVRTDTSTITVIRQWWRWLSRCFVHCRTCSRGIHSTT
jgi:hypothetical protein